MDICELRSYLDKIPKNDKFDYEDDQIKDTIINYIKDAGCRAEDYVQTFKRILVRIKRNAGGQDPNRKDGKLVNLYFDAKNGLFMRVYYVPQKTFWSVRYKIYKFEITERDLFKKKDKHSVAQNKR